MINPKLWKGVKTADRVPISTLISPARHLSQVCSRWVSLQTRMNHASAAKAVFKAGEGLRGECNFGTKTSTCFPVARTLAMLCDTLGFTRPGNPLEQKNVKAGRSIDRIDGSSLLVGW